MRYMRTIDATRRGLLLASIAAAMSGCASAIQNAAGVANVQFTVSEYGDIAALLREKLAGLDPFTLAKVDSALLVFDDIESEINTLSLADGFIALPLAHRRLSQAAAAAKDVQAVVLAHGDRFTAYDMAMLDDYWGSAGNAYTWLSEQLALLDARNAVNVDMAQYKEILQIGRGLGRVFGVIR